jgi:methylmalonyl-CoA/ethylmalonyl-CoA epimerase
MTDAPRKINHVGLAVHIEAFLRKSGPLYDGFKREPMIVNERQKVRELFMTDGATTVELLEPLGGGSPLQAFLNRNPSGGLIHLALEVTDLDAAIARLIVAGGRSGFDDGQAIR